MRNLIALLGRKKSVVDLSKKDEISQQREGGTSSPGAGLNQTSGHTIKKVEKPPADETTTMPPPPSENEGGGKEEKKKKPQNYVLRKIRKRIGIYLVRCRKEIYLGDCEVNQGRVEEGKLLPRYFLCLWIFVFFCVFFVYFCQLKKPPLPPLLFSP